MKFANLRMDFLFTIPIGKGICEVTFNDNLEEGETLNYKINTVPPLFKDIEHDEVETYCRLLIEKSRAKFHE